MAEDNASNLRLLQEIWSHLPQRRRTQAKLLTLFMVLTSAAEVFSIAAIFPFLKVLTEPDLLFEAPRFQPLVTLLGAASPAALRVPVTAIFCAGAVLAATMRVLLLWLSARISQGAGADVRITAFERTLYQPFEVHISRNSSDVIAAVNQKTQVLVSVMFSVLNLASAVLIVVSVMATLVIIDPVVTLSGVAGLGVIYAVVAWSARNRLKRNSYWIAQETSQLVRIMQEALGGIRDVILDATQPVYIRRYQGSEYRIRRAQASNQLLQNAPRFLIEALGMVAIAILALWMVGEGEPAGGAIATLGALALGVQRLMPVLQQIFHAWSWIQGSRRGIVDSLAFLEQPVPEAALIPISEVEPLAFKHHIRLTDIGFRYGDEGPMVLNGLQLEVRRGERIGVVGKTGGGKSTLLDLLMGLLVPVGGEMVVDEVRITRENQRAWQRRIAHVPQSIFLTDASIAENIAFGHTLADIDMDRVRWAAEQADIAEAIAGFAQGYQTEVGERGIRLSGGQRQRIGIARALYKAADVIVLDEATSALDNATERSVMGSIYGLGPDLTIFIVAHRVTTLARCDRIIEIADGRVARVGTYQAIVEGA